MKLDFLIIGAQKSATTALFKYLEPHTDLVLPAGKEAPLFTKEVSGEETQAFMEENFSGKHGKLKGKATPQYMCDVHIPARIHRHNPQMKLVAVLRDPIDRAWSHYRMNRRRETESRTFEQAMIEQLQPEALERARSGRPPLHEDQFESEGEYYLAWGEYGRILEKYLNYFPRKQLLVVYTSELKNDPGGTLDKVLSFLGLEKGFRPDCLGAVVHKGGSGKIVSTGLKHKIRDLWLVSAIWSRIPEAKREEVRYWFEQLNVKTSDETMELSASTYLRLASHFADDANVLASVTQTTPDWDYAVGELQK